MNAATAKTGDGFDRAATVHGLFAEQVRARSDAEAIAWHGGSWTYGRLDAAARVLVDRFAAAGVGAGDLVAVEAVRLPESIACLLALLRLGAAYLPVEPTWPAERIDRILAAAGVRQAVSPGRVASGLASAGVASLDGSVSALPGRSDLPVQADGLDGDTRAYVMYTSGSTGVPKGIEICHRGIVRLVRGTTFMHLGADTRMLQAAPLGFDASTLEIWGPLLNGGVCVLHDEAIPSGVGLARSITDLRADSAWLTAALFNAVVDDDPGHLRGLRQLLAGGEALSVPHVRRALAALPETVIVNGYGPTECTTFAATWRIPRDLPADAPGVPIGRAIQHTTLRIVGPNLVAVPYGEAGELCIGGPGLARGYLGSSELTRERFVPDPLQPGERLYRTGDRVRQRADGAIEFLGRIDDQVKIRGHRIEPGEVESVLGRDPAVRACAVVARPGVDGTLRLVACVVPEGIAPDWLELRTRLARHLPEPMLPVEAVWLQSLPVTTNGKLDRRALADAVAEAGRVRPRPETVPYAAPRDELEARVCQLWAELLGLDRLGRDDSFFDYGGDSLLAVRAAARLSSLVGLAVTPTLLYAAPTPAAATARLRPGASGQGENDARPGGTADALPPRRGPAAHGAIAIVGMAVRLPGAADVEAFWQNLMAGRDSVRRFAPGELDPAVPLELREDPHYVAARGVIDGVELFDAGFFGITPKEADLMDPQQRVFLELAWECLESAGHPPERAPGPIGVYAGMYNATYYQRHLWPRPAEIAALGEFQVMLANEKDYIATRTAHRLDLTGPAVSVHTACSTSLVAIAQAVLALRAGQCDLALAGGASVTCPPNSGYLHEDGSMLSRDGRTCTFAEGSTGTVFSDGAGVVLLRRLEDALADGDTVHAVIRGVAVNNDGRAKASFTAPGVAGQQRVVEAALADAGVSARSLSYVEAHGTATPLGDPVEVEALTAAHRRDSSERGYCVLGSVKSNIGHTVTAAGVAGVVKTALALEREHLPATLHAERLNPGIDFAATPFTVGTTARAWPRAGSPRRAGVSAFGVGGTNAHLVLEEAPLQPARDEPSAGSYALRLSARTPSALEQMRIRLAAHLESHPALRLDDVAHTLRMGRSAFAHRTVIVASGSDAPAILRDPESRVQRIGDAVPAVVFAFPGQGSQVARMGAELAARLPVFAAAFDAALEAMDDEAPADLRPALASADPAALAATAYAQPALFALGHALATVWRAAGVHPVAALGHSVGEFVAAVESGVLSLADAARLVALRGRLMQSMPSGAMLSVRLSAAQVLRRLPPGLSVAAENGPRVTVVAGPHAAIAAFRTELEALGEATRLLDTSHAFHSAMMDPVVAPFEAAVRGVALRPPNLPLISTLTGERLSDAEATDPRYWARHLRETVRFAGALQHVAARWSDAVVLECGPGAVLGGLVRQQASPGRPALPAVASLTGTGVGELASLQAAGGRLWMAGIDIDGAAFEPGPTPRRVPLPTYPFERRRHWIDAPAAAPRPLPGAAAFEPPTVATTAAPILPAAVPPGAAPRPTPDSQSPGATVPSDRKPRLVAELRALFENTSGIEMADVPLDAPFIEAGLDSLALTQIALQVRRSFGVDVSFRQLMSDLGTLGRVVAHLDQALPADAAALSAPVVAASVVPLPAAMPSTPPAGSVNAATLALLQQQMALISQQLALLGGAAPVAPVSSLAAAPAAASAVSSAAVGGAMVPPPPTPAVSAADPSAQADKPVTSYDVKTAFGAIARIHGAGGDPLTARQRVRLDALIRRYTERTAKSKAYTTEHRPHLADPRVVNGFRPLLKEMTYQIVMERSKGAWLWDIDGNAYVDALNGFGMSMFGWQPEFVQQAVRAQLEQGYEIGPQHVLAGDVARLVCEMTGFDRAGLCNTGSEAVMGCMRIARTVTGRGRIALFAGSYHGIFDEVIVRGTKSLRSIPAAPGIMPSAMQNVVVLDYGTPEALAWIEANADDLAAVLVEPVQSRRPDLQPREFLQRLREITASSGTLLVFDEVVTGFRCHPQGAQGLFDVRADLASYGKVVGGGFPIGIIAGKREFADALDGGHWQFGDDSTPTVGVTYFAGTFVRHPLALAATKAVLERLAAEGPDLQTRLTASTAAMVDELNAHCREVGAPIVLKSFASLWRVTFAEDHPLQDLLFAMMRSRGVHILDNFPCFMTTAHTPADIATIKAAFKDSVGELQEAEFLPRRPVTASVDASKPPVAHARLGRDKEGRPAWFVPDPASPGRFLKVEG